MDSPLDLLDYLHGHALVGFLPFALLSAAAFLPAFRSRFPSRSVLCSVGSTCLAAVSNLFGNWYSLVYAYHHGHADRLTPFEVSVAQLGEGHTASFGTVRVSTAVASLGLGIFAAARPKGRLLGAVAVACAVLALVNTNRYH